MPAKNIRQAAAQRSAIEREAEPVPPLPEPMASDPREGLRLGRERALLYARNLADLAASIAFGEGTRSLHTRLQSMQLLWSMMEAAPDPVPTPPRVRDAADARERAQNGEDSRDT